MILSAQTIRHLRIVEPFYERTVINGMSYGLSAAGYDIRCKQRLVLWPGDFSLASTVERVVLPNDVLAMVADKSTWARRGVAVQHTVIDPGFRGWVTLEISVNGRNGGPIIIEAGDPIAQMVFHRLDQPTDRPYSGKYLDQPDEPVPAKVEEGSHVARHIRGED